jgi:probable HAF family extracellular repeat protein
MRKVLLLLVGGLLLWTAGASGQSYSYLITELEPIDHTGTGTWETWATAINSRNQVVGVSTKQSSYINHATLWQIVEGEWVATDLGSLGGLQGSTAYGINDLGVVVGSSYLANGNLHAFSWDPVGLIQDLEAAYSNNMGAYAINRQGEVAGWFWPSGANEHPCRWLPGQPHEPLGTATGRAWAINDRGEKAGHAVVASHDHAFLWYPGGSTDLGTLVGGFNSFAYGINNPGQVVGKLDLMVGGNLVEHAVIWNEGVPADLGTLGAAPSEARAINSRGQVVGKSKDIYGTYRAFIWEAGTGMRSLRDLIPPAQQYHWNLSEATGINNNGFIVGTGMHDGVKRAFLLTPVRRPSVSGALLLLLLD